MTRHSLAHDDAALDAVLTEAASGPVELVRGGEPVGVVLSMADWQALADRLAAGGVRFAIEPHIRFKGQAGEQATMFFRDPAGNALEFKAFADLGQLFAR